MKVFNKDNFLSENKFDIFESSSILEYVHFPLNDMKNLTAKEMSTILNPYKNWKGLYIYKQGDRFLYVGKGSPIKNRVLSHLKETKLEHKDCPLFWQFFFNYYVSTGKIDLYILRVDDEEGRIVLESCYQHKYKSYFDILKKDFEDELRASGIKNVSLRGNLNSFSDIELKPYYQAFQKLICDKYPKAAA